MNQVEIPKDIRKRIDEYDKNLNRWTYYELLYITRNASTDDIKNGYRKIVQLMHPDRYGFNLDPEYKTKLERIFNEINIAYNTLLDPSQRARYDQSLFYAEDHGQPIKQDTDVLVAQNQYNQGVQALRQNNHKVAVEFFRSAIKLNPSIAEYHAKLAYALSLNPNPRVKKEAVEVCKEAIKMANENPNYHSLMGYIYQQLDEEDNAEIHYRRALSWDPLHHRSRQALNKILDNRNKQKQERSILGKLSSFLKPKTTETPIPKNTTRKTPPKK